MFAGTRPRVSLSGSARSFFGRFNGVRDDRRELTSWAHAMSSKCCVIKRSPGSDAGANFHCIGEASDYPCEARESARKLFRFPCILLKSREMCNLYCQKFGGIIIKSKYPWDSAKLYFHRGLSCTNSFRQRHTNRHFLNYIRFRLWLFFVTADNSSNDAIISLR